MSILENRRQMYAIFRHTAVALFCVVLALVIAMGNADWVDWMSCAAFVLISIICEFLPVRLSPLGSLSGDTSMSFMVIWAAIILWGPLAGMVVAVVSIAMAGIIGWVSCRLYFQLSAKVNALGDESAKSHAVLMHILSLLAHTWMDRKDYRLGWVLQLILFNACYEGLVSGISGLVFSAAGGTFLSNQPQSITISGFIVPIALALATHTIVDISGFTVIGVIWEPGNAYKKSLRDFVLRCRILLRQQFSMDIINYIILGPFGLILAYLQTQIGILSLAIIIVPFYATRDAFSLAVEQITVYRDTITTLGTYMQHYHPYTRGHLKRVAELSERLARELRLPPETIMLMPDAGMLHDIGKVGVSECILDKVGKLTDDEWERIKEHPIKGAEIVSHLEYLERIVDWVKYHHKWYNGQGYPDDGTKEVPIEAAIIAVADAFDAMTDDRELTRDWQCDSCGYKPEDGARLKSCPKCGAVKNRVYREPLSLEHALNELRRGAGTQFHPDVVRAFLRIMMEDHIDAESAESISTEQAA